MLSDFKSLSLKADQWARNFIRDSATGRADLQEISRHSISTGGKRIRPALVLAVGEMLMVPQASLQSLSIAIELIHAASLVHDDLPCMDNDDERRGQPTTHKVFGESAALLAGDRLFLEALNLLARDEDLPLNSRAEMLNLLSSAAVELCDGQWLDFEIQAKRMTCSEGLLIECHEKKTGALFRAASLGPGTLLEVERFKEVRPKLTEFGRNLGLLFQLTDDLLDHAESQENQAQVGQGENSFVTVFGRTRTEVLATECVERAQLALDCFGERASVLKALCASVRTRTV